MCRFGFVVLNYAHFDQSLLNYMAGLRSDPTSVLFHFISVIATKNESDGFRFRSWSCSDVSELSSTDM